MGLFNVRPYAQDPDQYDWQVSEAVRLAAERVNSSHSSVEYVYVDSPIPPAPSNAEYYSLIAMVRSQGTELDEREKQINRLEDEVKRLRRELAFKSSNPVDDIPDAPVGVIPTVQQNELDLQVSDSINRVQRHLQRQLTDAEIRMIRFMVKHGIKSMQPMGSTKTMYIPSETELTHN